MNETPPRRLAWIALGCAVFCTSYLAFFTPFPTVADERLALPIARAAADSTLYPVTDLVVSSGLQGPFHLYRAAGALYARGLDVDTIWLSALVVLLVASFAAAWAIAHGISRSVWISSLCVAVLAAASPYRGTLHWFLFPPGNLVTSTLATPLIMGALALALNGRWGWGLVLAALTFNVHPSMGLVSAGALALAMIRNDGLSWKRRLWWWAAAFACAAPNVAFVLRGSGANFAAAPSVSGHTFAELFGIYAHHAWVADHWRENYGWFVMQVAGVVLLRRHLGTEQRRAVFALLAGYGAITVTWFVNLYTINYPALTLAFALRGASFVKVIAFAALATCLAGWVREPEGRRRLARLSAAGLLLAGALHKNLDIGEGFAAIAWGAIVFMEMRPPLLRVGVVFLMAGPGLMQVLGQGWGILGVAPFSLEQADQARLGVLVASAVMLVAVAAAARTRVNAEPAKLDLAPGATTALATCLAVFALALGLRGSPARLLPSTPASIARAARLAEPAVDVADVTRWAARGAPAGSLFAIPPTDDRFNTFRLAAGRGVYASTYEVDQLSYDQAVYGTAHARLLKQGVVVRGRHAFDGAAWDTLPASSLTALAGEGVHFAVFRAERRLTRPLDFPVAFRDRLWIVHRIQSAP